MPDTDCCSRAVVTESRGQPGFHFGEPGSVGGQGGVAPTGAVVQAVSSCRAGPDRSVRGER